MMAHRDVSKEGVVHGMNAGTFADILADAPDNTAVRVPDMSVIDATARKQSTQDRIRLACDELKRTLIRKNNDYGNQFQKPLALAPSVDPVTALRVRLSDKIARLLNLLDKPTEQLVDESLDDTLMDAAGYFLLWKVQREIERLTK